VPSPVPPLRVPPTPAVSAPAATPATAAAPQASPTGAPSVASSGGATSPKVATAGTNAPLGIGIDTTWYLARQVDVHARSLGSIVPDYPDEARRRNQEGTLKLMVKIDDLGRVRDVEVVEADLPGVFDEAALEAFRNARFQPAMKDGRPVRYQAYIRVTFRLND
jgi:protein TonB